MLLFIIEINYINPKAGLSAVTLSLVFSTLSQVLNAVAALLIPFTWQHTFISTVPTVLMEVLMAPTPYLLGVHKNTLDGVLDKDDMDDVSLYFVVVCISLNMRVA